MAKKMTQGARIPTDIPTVVSDLLGLWLPTFAKLGWKQRLELLEQIDTQLAEDIADLEECRRVSELFTSELLRNIPLELVNSKEQAFIYLNSETDGHRQAARVWFVLNRVHCNLFDDETRGHGADKRSNTRYSVDIPGLIADNDSFAMGHLVDISATGAKVELYSALPSGTQVMLDIPFLGRVAAMVVWVAAAFVGLSFVTDQLATVLA
jgi:hypothetical protein